MKTVKIGNRVLDVDQQPFFVAELGICHEGRIDVALELTRTAVEAGADCVKTETFQRSTMVYDPSAMMSYSIDNKKYTVSLAEHMDRYELSFDEHHRIKLLCDELKVPFMSTAHDFHAVDFLESIGVAAIKIASPDIVHYPLLRYTAQKRIPVFLDTGSAYQHEIELAVKTLREEGLEDIVVNHNPQGHPAPADRHDLRVIPRLQDILGIPIGLADHFEGYDMLYAAVAVGANTVEKPISRDRFVHEPERNYSISIADLPDVLLNLRNVHSALGKPEKAMSKEAENYRDRNRMACVAARNLRPGDLVSFDNITFGRPRKGIGVEHWDLIEGRKIRHAINQHEFLRWDDL